MEAKETFTAMQNNTRVKMRHDFRDKTYLIFSCQRNHAILWCEVTNILSEE